MRLIEAEVERAVQPFEIEAIGERLAHLRVGEDRPLGVEDEAAHRLRNAWSRNLSWTTRPSLTRREIVLRRPARRIGLADDVEEALLEGLEIAVGVAVVLDLDLVEIVEAALDRKILAPIVVAALQRDAPPGVDLGDAVGPGAERGGERRLVEGRGIDRVLRQDRPSARSAAAARGSALPLKVKRTPRSPIFSTLSTAFCSIGRVGGRPFSRSSSTVKITSSGFTGSPSANFASGRSVNSTHERSSGDVDRFGQEPVERERLVAVAGEQALPDVAPERLVPEAARRGALDDERIEAVEACRRSRR